MRGLISFRRQMLIIVSLLAPILVAAGEPPQAACAVVAEITRRVDGSILVDAHGPAGMVYSLQISNSPTDWRTLDFTNSPSGNAVFRENTASLANGTRHYRVQVDSPGRSARFTEYHGWTNSILMRNRQVEVAIVPAVGRIMQFRFLDQTDGPFWENPSLAGVQPSANAWNSPGSFGGDKVWPAPQTWPWPPPRGFDSMPYTATITNGGVTLTGPVDSAFGTRVVRRIELHPEDPVLRVVSTLEKISGDPSRIGVWVITQVKAGERVFVPIPKNSIFSTGYTAIGSVPRGLAVTNGLVALSSDPNTSSKIGNDAGALLWVGTNSMLLIESPRVPGVAGSSYPDEGCSAEVYTNPNPAAYIELELLAPLASLEPNSTSEATSIYSLFRRTQPSSFDEAKLIFAP